MTIFNTGFGAINSAGGVGGGASMVYSLTLQPTGSAMSVVADKLTIYGQFFSDWDYYASIPVNELEMPEAEVIYFYKKLPTSYTTVSISMPNVRYISHTSTNAVGLFENLSVSLIDLPELEAYYIPSYYSGYLFSKCLSITEFRCPKLGFLCPHFWTGGSYSGYRPYTSFYFPKVSKIYPGSTSIYFNSIFKYCYITDLVLDFSNLTSVPEGAFWGNVFCMSSLEFTGLESIGSSTFSGFVASSSNFTMNFPNVSIIDRNAFSGFHLSGDYEQRVLSFSFPKVSSINYSAFLQQNYLSSNDSVYINLGSVLSYIGPSAFFMSQSLGNLTLDLRSASRAPAYGSDAICPPYYGTLSIYVPKGKYTTFTRANGWSSFSSHMISV